MPGMKRGRHEYRRKNQCNADDGSGDLLHRLKGSRLGGEALLDVVLDRFHHHNGVIHHQADGQHHAKQRERVDGEAEQREEHERANERNRHGQ